MADAAMLSVRAVAELLGVRPHSVTALIRSGQLRAHDVSLIPGGRPTWRVEQEELASFLRRRAHAATQKRRRRKTKPIKQYF